MSNIKKSITINPWTHTPEYQGIQRYQVVHTVNTTTPKLFDDLTEDDVNKLIEAGIKVTIKPRN